MFQEVSGTPYPNGKERKELFTVSETGIMVQLTDDPGLESNIIEGSDACPRWAMNLGVVYGEVSYIAKSKVNTPSWSPTGSHVFYQHRKFKLHAGFVMGNGNVHRATAEGGDEKDLTKDISERVFPIEWCGD